MATNVFYYHHHTRYIKKKQKNSFAIELNFFFKWILSFNKGLTRTNGDPWFLFFSFVVILLGSSEIVFKSIEAKNNNVAKDNGKKEKE